MQASAIVFQAPLQLSVQTLQLRPPEPDDLEIEVLYSGISTGTERLLWDGSMPAFPGMGYPLVPGYETVGVVRRAPKDSPIREGETVFVPGSYSFDGVHNLFGGAGSMLRAKPSRVVRVQPTWGHRAVLLALAATAYHAVSLGGKGDPATPPDLIIGHGVVGRLLARLTVAAGMAPPTVWETSPARQGGGEGYAVIHPDDDARKDYRAIYDVSGDADILHRAIPRLQLGGEVVLAGFYKDNLSFAYAPAFMREARIRVAAEWKRPDLLAVTQLVEQERLSLDGLITHTEVPGRAHEAYEVAFGDSHCLKMVLNWSH